MAWIRTLRAARLAAIGSLGAAVLVGCSSDPPVAEGPGAQAHSASADGSGGAVASTRTSSETSHKPATDAPSVLREPSAFEASAGTVVDRTPSSRPQIVLRTTAGDVTIELFRDEAPRTVANFLDTYAENGLYSGTIFHHVEPGQMAISGGYDEQLRSVYAADPIENESSPKRPNVRGTLSMIRLPDAADSATSQFFVNLKDNPSFDASVPGEGYCVFGRVVNGIDIVDAIAATPTVATGPFEKMPEGPITIASVDIVRY